MYVWIYLAVDNHFSPSFFPNLEDEIAGRIYTIFWKTKSQEKDSDVVMSSVGPDQTAIQVRLPMLVEDICSRAEIFNDDREEAEWLSMPLSHLRVLANEIMSL
ncbi:unnamed protein product [Prunus armeniaca]